MAMTETNKINTAFVYYVYGNTGGKNITVDKETDDVCAKNVIATGTFTNSKIMEEVENGRYYIKCGPDGIFNPLTLDKRMHNRYTKKGLYKWCLVNKQAFDLYLQFLRTGKNQFLHQSERLF